MEAAPPSYETATLTDYWDLIADYIPSSDLCAAALVCSRWHRTFSPYLWGNPASHFGIENDRVYVALTKFNRTLQFARLLVRSQTHTLHLPPAHAEIYNGPHSDWLRDILSRLPNLQSLIVRGLPFFDHNALVALKQAKPVEQQNGRHNPHSFAVELPGSTGTTFQSPPNSLPSFSLRLLDASRCPNVTSTGLAQALRHFEGLIYLDLSNTYPARDVTVAASIRRLRGLQVLKLRGINLRDAELEVFAAAISTRVRSLDLRDNKITDSGLRTLLDQCFISHTAPQADTDAPSRGGARSPALMPYLGAEMLEKYQNDEFDGFLRSAFTGAFVSRLAIEDVPEGGITHLYISNNKVTVEGASGLIRSQRLHVLDIGEVSGTLQRHPSLNSQSNGTSEWQLLGAEKLVPVLHENGKDGLTYLRLDHSLVTRCIPGKKDKPVGNDPVELADTALPEIPRNIPELGGERVAQPCFELSADAPTPRYELQGSPLDLVVTPAETPKETDSGVRRGSAYAPEAVVEPETEGDTMKLLSPTTTLDNGSTINGNVSPLAETPAGAPQQFQTLAMRPRSYSGVASERMARLNAHTSVMHTLHPAMLPHLRTLILTDFPAFSKTGEQVDRLIEFIKDCAREALGAQAQARLDYSLPPGRRDQASALRHSANKIFGLKTIVLEMAPDRPGAGRGHASPWHTLTTKSMTEDRDSEALWSAAETDFSFFGEEDECAFPSIESERYSSVMSPSEKEVDMGRNSPVPSMQSKTANEAKVDNIAILTAFRKDRKLAYQQMVNRGLMNPETEGYWPGAIQVVRPYRGTVVGEELDYYGNQFEKNYLYR